MSSEDVREKLSRSGKERFARPGEREKLSHGQRERFACPGEREKH